MVLIHEPHFASQCCCVLQDGCWGCFDELQLIRREAVAVLLEHVQAIQSALRADQDYCMVGDGQEVPFTITT